RGRLPPVARGPCPVGRLPPVARGPCPVVGCLFFFCPPVARGPCPVVCCHLLSEAQW
ncbi:unnamed protein product, partial [Staurois parvus]